VWQWVVSVPKRLRGLLADRPPAVAVLTKIFLTEIERLPLAVAGRTPDADLPRAARPRLGGISFLHRFGSALNRHVHLHACVTDGVFVLAAAEGGTDAPPTFLPARPMTPADLATLTERVRRRVIRGPDGRIAGIRYGLPSNKAANWVGPGRGRKSKAPLARHLTTPKAKLMARVGEEFPLECPACGGDIRLRGDGRQEPAHAK
jgi:hypothetical protein